MIIHDERHPGVASALAAAHVAADVIQPAGQLFLAGGKEVLTEAAQAAVKESLEEGTRLLSGANPVVKTLGQEVTKTATKEIAKGVSRAAGLGFVVDGAIGCLEAATQVLGGDLSPREGIRHALKEGATGAVASGAGVLAVGSVVALTGGLAAPVALALAASTSMASKYALSEILS